MTEDEGSGHDPEEEGSGNRVCFYCEQNGEEECPHPACPYCGSKDGDCSHHLGDFDRTFDTEGLCNIGLEGGALCEVEVIEHVFCAIVDNFAAPLWFGSPDAGLPTLRNVAAYREFYSRLDDCVLDRSEYDDAGDYVEAFKWCIVDRTDSIRKTLRHLIEVDLGHVIAFSAWGVDQGGMPGFSSACENWWSQTGSELVQQLDSLLRTHAALLDPGDLSHLVTRRVSRDGVRD